MGNRVGPSVPARSAPAGIVLMTVAIVATLAVALILGGTENWLRVAVGFVLLVVTGLLSRLSRLLSGDDDMRRSSRSDRYA
jgi:uncharacterized membrane protein